MLSLITNFFQPSPKSLRFIHIGLRILLLVGLFHVYLDINLVFLSIISYYVFINIGLSIMLHRYFSHRSFEFKNKFIRNISILISILSLRGSPLAWAYIHKQHHENVDTENDPHTPLDRTFNLLGLVDQKNLSDNLHIFKIRNLLTKEQMLINQYYYLIVLIFVLPLALLNFQLFFYLWLLPIVVIQISINLQNFIGHLPIIGAYRNFNNKFSGNSQNNIILWPLYLGEAWHNNHHSIPSHFHYGKEISGKWWEIDPAAFFIKMVKR